MQLTRHFRFKAFGSAVSGLIYVPDTTVIDIDCGSSSLGIAGGRARSSMKDRSFGDAVRVASATTFVEGIFDDEKMARAVVNGEARQDSLSSTTTVITDVQGMSVGNNNGPFFTARRLLATLVSRSPEGSGEPRIAPHKDPKKTVIEGVSISGHNLAVALDLELFQTCDTRSKLVAAADDRKLAKTVARHMAMTTAVDGQASPSRPRLISSGDTIYTTIVRGIRWTGKPFPGATIDGHTVTVPDFGTIFFGEMMIASMERRLTLARFQLGSPLKGFIGGGDAGSNGVWFP